MGIKQVLYVVAAILLVCLIAWGANSYPRKGVVDDILKAREGEIKTEYAATIKQKDESIAKLNKEIGDINIRLVARDQEILMLKAKRTAIKKPQTPQDTVEAFTALGYPPVK